MYLKYRKIVWNAYLAVFCRQWNWRWPWSMRKPRCWRTSTHRRRLLYLSMRKRWTTSKKLTRMSCMSSSVEFRRNKTKTPRLGAYLTYDFHNNYMYGYWYFCIFCRERYIDMQKKHSYWWPLVFSLNLNWTCTCTINHFPVGRNRVCFKFLGHEMCK